MLVPDECLRAHRLVPFRGKVSIIAEKTRCELLLTYVQTTLRELRSQRHF